MSVLKKAAAFLTAAGIVVSCAACGYNTRTALTVDGAEIPAGIYIYYANAAYNEAVSKLQEEDSELDTSDKSALKGKTVEGKDIYTWIQDKATQQCAEYAVIEKKFNECGLSFDEETDSQVKMMKDYYWEYSKDGMIKNGVSEESYSKILESSYKTGKVFEYYYGIGGEKGTTEEQVYDYYKENNIRAEFLEMPLKDGEGNLLKSDGKKEIMALAEDYQKRVEEALKDGGEDAVNAEMKKIREDYQAYQDSLTPTEDETSEDGTTEAETSDEETTEAETSDEETTEAETSDEETTKAETSDEETTEAETSDEETTEVADDAASHAKGYAAIVAHADEETTEETTAEETAEETVEETTEETAEETDSETDAETADTTAEDEETTGDTEENAETEDTTVSEDETSGETSEEDADILLGTEESAEEEEDIHSNEQIISMIHPEDYDDPKDIYYTPSETAYNKLVSIQPADYGKMFIVEEDESYYLVIRYDIENRMNEDDLWTDSTRESAVSAMFSKTFEKELEDWAAAANVQRNEAAYKRYDPFKFDFS
ncbi:MAG: hypothetical protein K6F80_03575 [Oscillospiraceae bacterium]|nr:hypothetical protein [Oscillospiraceae bacterium]